MKWPSLRRRSTVPKTFADEVDEAPAPQAVRRRASHLGFLNLRAPGSCDGAESSKRAWITFGAFSLDAVAHFSGAGAPTGSEVGQLDRPIAGERHARGTKVTLGLNSSSRSRPASPPVGRDRDVGCRRNHGARLATSSPPLSALTRSHEPFGPSSSHPNDTLLLRLRRRLSSTSLPPPLPASTPVHPSSRPSQGSRKVPKSCQGAPDSTSTPPLVAVRIGIALDSDGRRVLSNRKRMSQDPHQSFAPTPVQRIKHSHGLGPGEDDDNSARRQSTRDWLTRVNWADVGAAPSFAPPTGSPPLPAYAYTCCDMTNYSIADLYIDGRSALEAGRRIRPSQPDQAQPRAPPSLRRRPASHNLRRQSHPVYFSSPIQPEHRGFCAPATWPPRRRSLELGEIPTRCPGILRVSFPMSCLEFYLPSCLFRSQTLTWRRRRTE